MNVISTTLVSLGFWLPIQEPEPTNYQRAMRGLEAKEIRADLTAEQLLDRCLPTSRRTIRRFAVYVFEFIPGYHGITVLAKDGRLRSAKEYSCTYARTFFNGLAPDDTKEIQKLWKENPDVPFERLIGRWGWERPREREWRGDGAEPKAKSKP